MEKGAMRSLAIGLTLATLLAACASDDGAGTAEGSPAAESPTADESATAGPATVGIGDTDLGSILVDADGLTLYMFEADTDGSSTCYDECADAWPALMADEPVAGDGVDEALLGTTERDDGSLQVTYADQPLYHFASDAAAGDIEGQGVGDVWFVVDASGEAVTDKADKSGPGY